MGRACGQRPKRLCVAIGLLTAIAAWTAALAAKPNDTQLLTRVAAAHARLGRLDAAEATMLRAAAIEPGSPKVRQNLALVYFRQKRFDKALETFDAVLERQPTYPETHYYIGVIHEMRGDDASAVKHYVLDVNNGPSRAWERLERYKEKQRELGLASRGPEPKNVLVFSAIFLIVAGAAYGFRLYLDSRHEEPHSPPES